MKVNELRIGNWVKSDGGIPFQIELSDFSDWYYDYNSHEYGDHIHPVLLTEVWLKDFGFKKDEIRPIYKKSFDEYAIEITVNVFSGSLEKDESWFVSILTGYGSQPVTLTKQYVHQLQNLYFVLTGEELTTNEQRDEK